MDDATLLKLYQRLADRKAAGPQAVRDRPPEKRLAYHAEANRKARAKAKAAIESGELEPTRPIIRQVLADAAVMILAVDGPGAEQIRAVLASAFPTKPGIPLTVTQNARSGRLRPKLAVTKDS